MHSKSIIFTVISVIVLVFIHSSISVSEIFAVPPDKNWGGSDSTCTYSKVAPDLILCCWTEGNTTYCQDCVMSNGEFNCTPKEPLFLEQPTTTSPPNPKHPLQEEGVLEQPSNQEAAPSLSRGQDSLQQDDISQ